MEYRLANSKDQANIAKLHAQSWRESYKEVLSESFLKDAVLQDRQMLWSHRFEQPKDNQYVVVAHENNLLCGFICAFGNEHQQWGTFIDNLHVSSANKGQGIGKRLMGIVVHWAKQQYPGKGMYLEVLAANTAAQQFYLRLGAVNQAQNDWQPPEGGPVKEFLYVWPTMADYCNKSSPIG